METALGVLVGFALAAACGFRVFVPFLVMGLAASSGRLELAGGFEWIGTTPAIIVFGVAAVVEILAFYLPWVDNLLDAAAQPVAMVAGVVVMAAAVTDMAPLWKWSLAVVAGGGVAGTLQGGTALARGLSTVTTGGLGNVAVSTLEGIAAAVTAVLAIVVPLLAVLLVVGLLAGAFRLWTRRRRRRSRGYSSG